MPLPTPLEMIAHLDRHVLGQARAKQDLAVAVYNHYLAQAQRARTGQDLGRYHILLIGPTGVGKTYLVKTLADFLKVPVGFASAAGLVEAGYKGNSVETLVGTLIDRAEGDARRAEKGIVFVDEIDKIRRGEGGFRDVSGEGVQNALLTLLDGRLSQGLEGSAHPAVDTSRLLFVCTGAFVGLADIVRRRLGEGRGKLGFRPHGGEAEERVPEQPVYEALCQAQTGDLVEYGMIPEFIGRFATLTVLHELPRSTLRSIVAGEVESSALARQQALARLHGIELEFTGDALDAIAEEAAALGTGARGLHRLIGRAVDGVDHRWPELADEGVCRVVVGRDCVEHGAPPELVRGVATSARSDRELREDCLRGVSAGGRASPSAGGWTDTAGWSKQELEAAIDRIEKEQLAINAASQPAREWWKEFRAVKKSHLPLVLRLCEELRNRKATLAEFFSAYLISRTENIQSNLHFLDYLRLKG